MELECVSDFRSGVVRCRSDTHLSIIVKSFHSAVDDTQSLGDRMFYMT